MNRHLTALARHLGYQRLHLTHAQHTGHACVHCARPFTPTETPEPYGRRYRQCAGFCVLEVADDAAFDALMLARVTATRPAGQIQHYCLGFDDQPDPAWLAAQPLVTLAIADGVASARTRPIPEPYAHRLAHQAARLGFDAEITEHADGSAD